MSARTVLVVEDAYGTRRLVELSLRMDGYEVIECENGITGLETALTVLPDLIVLDIALPGMDGWEILKELRADPRAEHIPVLVITAHDTAESRTRANYGSADGFIGKPFDLHELRDAVRTLIEGRSSPATATA